MVMPSSSELPVEAWASRHNHRQGPGPEAVNQSTGRVGQSVGTAQCFGLVDVAHQDR